MLIGHVATRSGVSAKTIRYYEAIGLLAEPERHANGYRDYPEAILERLAFIRAAQASGFTLGEIREIIAFRDQGQLPCDHVRNLIGRHAADVERRIGELQLVRDGLDRLARRASRLDPDDCLPSDVCHILAPRAAGPKRAIDADRSR